MSAKKMAVKDYCDTLYSEFFDMKSRLGEFVTTMKQMEGKDKQMLSPYSRHLDEMIAFIDWKLEIFNKVCPVDWSKYSQDFESTVSVPPVERSKEGEQTAGGYLGG